MGAGGADLRGLRLGGRRQGGGLGGTRSLRLLLRRKDAWILWQTVTGGSRGAEDGRPRVMPGDRRPEPPQRGVLAVLGTAGAEASDGGSPGDPVATHTCAQLRGSKHPVSARRAAQGCSAGSGGAGRDRTRRQGRRRRETLFWVRLLRSLQCRGPAALGLAPNPPPCEAGPASAPSDARLGSAGRPPLRRQHLHGLLTPLKQPLGQGAPRCAQE